MYQYFRLSYNESHSCWATATRKCDKFAADDAQKVKLAAFVAAAFAAASFTICAAACATSCAHAAVFNA